MVKRNKIKNVIAILMCIITFLMGPISTNGKVMGNLPIPIRCNQIDVSVIDMLPFQLFSLGNVEEIDLKVKKLTKFKGINMPFSDVKKLSINYEESGIDIYEMPDFGVESVKISFRGKEDNDTLRKIIVPDGMKEISVSGFDETFTQVLISESVETVNIEECEEWNHMLTYLPMSVKEINLIDNSGKCERSD